MNYATTDLKEKKLNVNIYSTHLKESWTQYLFLPAPTTFSKTENSEEHIIIIKFPWYTTIERKIQFNMH